MSIVNFYYGEEKGGGNHGGHLATDPSISHSPNFHHHARPFAPVTPIHSAQHSLNSSISSRTRTPLQPLSLHEYRKQQSSPAPLSATPPGKTLRRRAATPTLKGVERVPRQPASNSSSVSSSRPLRPLHFSHSAHQLKTLPPSPTTPPEPQQQTRFADNFLRSQSTGTRDSIAIVPWTCAEPSNAKVSTWKRIKRLPKPLYHSLPISPTSPTTSSPPALETALSPLLPIPYWSTDNLLSPGTHTESSTVSLSRFPRPPLHIEPPLSPPNDENEKEPLCLSFASAAPVTPPATPAVIHYRGTSFDLVNPHDSLLFHDIVTPSRDIDSTGYSPQRLSEELLISSEVEMAQRRLFENYSSAFQTITGRDDSPSTPNLTMPEPAHVGSSGPSPYSSPEQVHDSDLMASPLKSPNDSRFSLKKLTRSFTKRLGRNQDLEHGEELHDLPSPLPQVATPTLEGRFPRSLHESYPIDPTDHPIRGGSYDLQAGLTYTDMPSPPEFERDYPRTSLSSMVPDESTTSMKMGRGAETRASISGDNIEEPYYERLSIYPSSSIYTRDDGDGSGLPPSLRNSRRISSFAGLTYEDDTYYPSGYPRMSGHLGMHSPIRESLPGQTPYSSQHQFQQAQPSEQTDTLDKFIEQYKEKGYVGEPERLVKAEDHEIAQRSKTVYMFANPPKPATGKGKASYSGAESDLGQTNNGPIPSGDVKGKGTVPQSSDDHPHCGNRFMDFKGKGKAPLGVPEQRGFSQFNFDLDPGDDPEDVGDLKRKSPIAHIQPSRARKATVTHVPAIPASLSTPLAPAFEYGETTGAHPRDNTSGVLSASSYGDTRRLLQLSDSSMSGAPPVPPVSSRQLEPSSSYSQPEVQSEARTLQEALDHAEQVFNETEDQGQVNIPVMWSRRGSGNLLRNRTSAHIVRDENEDEEAEKSDWETIDEPEPRPSGYIRRYGRWSLGSSTADVSDDENTPDFSTYPNRRPPPPRNLHPVVLEMQAMPSRGAMYTHPSPLPPHQNPFSSSPPGFTQASIRSAPEEQYHSSVVTPSGPSSSTVPYLRRQTGEERYELVREHSPWTARSPYGLSDKETQELLNSGPNEEIMYETSENDGYLSPPSVQKGNSNRRTNPGLARDNTFAKFSVLGPRANLTGTPGGTGMRETGSSIGDNSSPGAVWSSSPGSVTSPHLHDGHYVHPHRASNIASSSSTHKRTSTQQTLFPSHYRLPSLPHVSSPLSPGHRSARSTRSVSGRSAVAGQTRLRHMMLATDTRTISSSRTSRRSDYYDGENSERPSSTKTETPLRALGSRNQGSNIVRPSPTEDLPRLICPERATSHDDEYKRQRLSWIIFGIFCLFPPGIILYCFLGDWVIAQISEGRFGHCSRAPKYTAFGAGVVINLVCPIIIVTPILIAHNAGRL